MGRTEGPDNAPLRLNRDRDRRGPRSTQSRIVLISKALSRLLRHQAQNEGVPITSDGWVRLDHLFAWRGFSGRNGVTPAPSVEEIWEVVEENEKKRFAVRWTKDANAPKTTAASTPNELHPKAPTSTELVAKTGALDLTAATDSPGQEAKAKANAKPEDTDMDTDPLPPRDEAADSETNAAIKAWRSGADTTPSHYLIRATQGHSIKAITATSDLLRPITLSDPSSIPATCVHGTFYGAWPLILRSGGLKPMGRNHVHFAAGPALTEVLPYNNDNVDGNDGNEAVAAAEDEQANAKVISGMRRDAQILIYIDLRACLEDVSAKGARMEWWRSENGVLLTAGVVEGEGDSDMAAVEMQRTEEGEARAQTDETEVMNDAVEESASVESAGSRGRKQKNHVHASQSKGSDAGLVPMKYWTVVVEVKRGLGVLWRQGQGVVRDLPPDLLARGTPKGSRGGGGRSGRSGRGGRGAWRGR